MNAWLENSFICRAIRLVMRLFARLSKSGLSVRMSGYYQKSLLLAFFLRVGRYLEKPPHYPGSVSYRILGGLGRKAEKLSEASSSFVLEIKRYSMAVCAGETVVNTFRESWSRALSVVLAGISAGYMAVSALRGLFYNTTLIFGLLLMAGAFALYAAGDALTRAFKTCLIYRLVKYFME